MRMWTISGGTLGFALGGFFDGILLHQILQWHHLLSLVSGMADLRTQILWDGYFHALMYILAVLALWGLWLGRPVTPVGRRYLLGLLLAGFGAWHIVDAVVSHWVLGIHRVRLDSPNPLMWDLLWLAAFGLLPIALARLIWRRRQSRAARGTAAGRMLAILAITSAAIAYWSLQPPPGQRLTTVVFAPDVNAATIIDAVSRSGARLAWSDARMSVIVVEVPPGRAWDFYRSGAILITGSGLPSGCFNWSRA